MFDRFRAYSPGRQILLIGLFAAAIGAVLASAWFFWLRTEYRPLFIHLRPTDATVIMTDLDRKKIPYRLADEGTTILVPEDKVDVTRLNVMTEDLPLHGTVGFELFNKSDMGLTDFAQKINYQRALQGELARTIMSLDDVESARVHLSMGEDRIFRDDRVPPKASVTIRMKSGAHLSPRIAQGIQRLIAGAVPKLEVANVVILGEEGEIVAAAPPAAAESVSPRAQERHAIEQFYAARIREALNVAYPGDGFVVTVAASLPDSAEASLSNWYPTARPFPLQVLVSPEIPMDANAEVNLRSIVATAMGASTVGGDVLTVDLAHDGAPIVRTATGMASAPPADPGDVRPLPTPPGPVATIEGGNEWLFETGVTSVFLVLMLIGFVLLVRRVRGPRRLSERQRADFAARLRAALEREDGHATARS